MSRASLVVVAALIAGTSLVAAARADKPVAGTKGTVTAWESGGTKVIAVESCTAVDDDWDYVSCSKVLRERVVAALCKRGAGKYSWGYQVGDEKPFLMQATTCK